MLCLAGCCAHVYLGCRPVHVGHGGTRSEIPATHTGVNDGCVDEGNLFCCVGVGNASRRVPLLPISSPFGLRERSWADNRWQEQYGCGYADMQCRMGGTTGKLFCFGNMIFVHANFCSRPPSSQGRLPIARPLVLIFFPFQNSCPPCARYPACSWGNASRLPSCRVHLHRHHHLLHLPYFQRVPW